MAPIMSLIVDDATLGYGSWILIIELVINWPAAPSGGSDLSIIARRSSRTFPQAAL